MRTLDPWGLNSGGVHGDPTGCYWNDNNQPAPPALCDRHVHKLVVTYPNGAKCTPYSKVKKDFPLQAQKFGVPAGTPVPIVVPPGINPQADVNYWGSGWTSFGTASSFTIWWALPDQNYKKTISPIFDAYGNYEFGATAKSAGFDPWSVRLGAWAAHGFNDYDPQNMADYTAGYNAIAQGGKLSAQDTAEDACSTGQ